jgi:glucokinase
VAANRVIGVDVGGTKILAGIVDRRGRVERRHERPTPTASQEALVAALETTVEELLDGDIDAIGFGMPSRVDQATGLVEGSVNIPLAGLALREVMAERFGLPVGLENDASAATLAEFHIGAGREATTLVMLTLGTGCGGGIVIDGELYRGWAELGHIVIVADGLPCQGSCTGRGHLESYVSGHAATRVAQETFGPEVEAHELVALARGGDDRAQTALTAMGRHLGAGIASLVNIFRPEIVVVGGGFAAGARDFILEPARLVTRTEALAPAGARVRIVPAELENEAGMIGAGFVAFDALA